MTEQETQAGFKDRKQMPCDRSTRIIDSLSPFPQVPMFYKSQISLCGVVSSEQQNTIFETMWSLSLQNPRSGWKSEGRAVGPGGLLSARELPRAWRGPRGSHLCQVLFSRFFSLAQIIG